MKRLPALTPVLLFVFCSCGHAPDEPIWRPLDGGFVVNVRETYPYPGEVGVPEPTLLLVSDDILECSNYRIDVQVQRLPHLLLVEIRGVRLHTDVCDRAEGPAIERIPLPDLAAYDILGISYEGDFDWYSVTADLDAFHLRKVEGTFSTLTDTLVWRYPTHSMAYSCGTLTMDSNMCDQFLDSLKAHVALREIAVPPVGYWPYLRFQEGHYYDMPIRVFSYANASDFEIAGVVLVSFTKSILRKHEGAGLSLRNWRNEQYRSWLVPWNPAQVYTDPTSSSR